MAVAYHEFRTLILGYKTGAATDYPMTSADGVENLAMSGGLIGGGGIDGGALAPLKADVSSWVVIVDVKGANDAAYITQRDTLKAKTWRDDNPLTEHAYDIYVGAEAVRTRFARCTSRDIPHDETSIVRNFGIAQLVFESSDPLTYTAQQTSAALDPADTLVITGAGWAPSYRWTWTVQGPATNPQIASSGDASMKVRYVGVVEAGDTLVVTLGPKSLTCELEGVNVYGSLDGGAGSNRAPQWFPIVNGAQTLTYSTTAGAGTCTFAWREAKP